MDDRARIIAKEDRISNLPNGIIHRILSFLDMKYAVQTSALSKRWKHIWTSMPHLNLNSQTFRTSDKFVKFVNDALSHRNHGLEVSTVELSVEGGTLHFNEVVTSVVNYACSRNVRKLTIEWFWNIKLPGCLFSCHTLKHLTLTTHDDTAAYGLSVPNSPWDFPALETLYLTNIEFRQIDDYIEYRSSLNLFSKCVNLKDLTLHRCYMFDVDIFDVCAPQLSTLTIMDPFRFPKVFNIVAPKLKCLTASVEDMCSNFLQLLVEDLDSLEKVNLSVGPHPSQEKRHVLGLLDLFQKLCSAKFLILETCSWLRYINFHGYWLSSLLLVYYNLFRSLLSTCREFLRKPCPFNNLKYVKIEKQKNRTTKVPTYIKNYFLKSSPRVTFVNDLPKVPQKRSREEVHEGTIAKKVSNVTKAQQKKSREEVDKSTMVEKALSSCMDQPSHEPPPFHNMKCLNQTDRIPITPIEFRNQLLESSPSATFHMDLPQVPHKRSRKEVDKGTMAKKGLSSCKEQLLHKASPSNLKTSNQKDSIPRTPIEVDKSQLLKSSPSTTFNMDLPQVPHKRSRMEADNDTMANTLDKEIQQTKIVDEEKRRLEEKISMQDEHIAEQKKMLEAMKVQHEKKMLEAKIHMQDEIIAQQKKALLEATKLLHENGILEEKLQDKVIAEQKAMLETIRLQNEKRMLEAKIQRQDKIIAEQKTMLDGMRLQLQHEKIGTEPGNIDS
ncbi:hypothetical protein OSB04_019775 [Centaurea solstitialis]|uniref:F-box domain-containing protein n=1 Tax=Centaurea solstitialis TaxID=347529 RepID=A0AA38W5B6_9ASTR|nr:hypothetical protein OSB04_019775 [Centaurea solstitialis]